MYSDFIICSSGSFFPLKRQKLEIVKYIGMVLIRNPLLNSIHRIPTQRKPWSFIKRLVKKYTFLYFKLK